MHIVLGFEVNVMLEPLIHLTTTPAVVADLIEHLLYDWCSIWVYNSNVLQWQSFLLSENQ